LQKDHSGPLICCYRSLGLFPFKSESHHVLKGCEEECTQHASGKASQSAAMNATFALLQTSCGKSCGVLLSLTSKSGTI